MCPLFQLSAMLLVLLQLLALSFTCASDYPCCYTQANNFAVKAELLWFQAVNQDALVNAFVK